MVRVYCFGNEFVKEDSLAKVIADELVIEGVLFVKTNDPMEMLEEEELWIMDVANVKEPVLLKDIDKIKSNKSVSCHDFDLSFYLNLAKQSGFLKKVRIICLPMEGNKEKIKDKVVKLIKSIPHNV